MKILHTVESYDPASHGMQQVVKQLSERLVEMGHEVTVATKFDSARHSMLINGVKIEQFKISGRYTGGFNGSAEEIDRYKKFLLNTDHDIVVNFAAQQWATDLALPILKDIKAVKVFVPTGFSEINNPAFSPYFDLMREWLKDYDMNVFLSDDYQDINFARKNGVNNITLIPNGASSEEFSETPLIDIRNKLGIPADHHLILHVGSHTGMKGHAEAISIFKKADISNATLLIIGNATHGESLLKHFSKFAIKIVLNVFRPGQVFPSCLYTCLLSKKTFKYSRSAIFENKKLLVENLSRDETVNAYKAADLFLFPSNIECSPLVLFEAMAAKTPFLTTDVGNAREIIEWTGAGALLPTVKTTKGYGVADINGSAKMLKQLLADRGKREEMAGKGYQSINDKFSWRKIASDYEGVYTTLLNKVRPNR